MKYAYKDFDTGKIRFTRGRFVQWYRGGILNAWYAVFERKSDTLFIPEYCLTPETDRLLSPHN